MEDKKEHQGFLVASGRLIVDELKMKIDGNSKEESHEKTQKRVLLHTPLQAENLIS